MSGWMQVIWVLITIALIWWLFSTIQKNPTAFSKTNLSKSIFTLGILTLLLIGFITLCILFIRGL